VPAEYRALYLVALGAFGLVFGSFANVVIWRFPRGESLSRPPSHCPRCGHPIRWYDNVPVLSWVLLGGKCRDCGQPISWRYPLVELASGTLWALAGLLYGFSPRAAAAVLMFYLLLILSLIDLDTMRLPNPLVGLLAAVGLVCALCSQFTAFSPVPITQASGTGVGGPLMLALLGAVLGAGISLAVAGVYALVRKASGFGMGDVKLLGALGLFFGPYVVMVLFFGSLIGAFVGIALVAGSEAMRTKKIPFGPMLALASIVTAVAGPSIWAWYASIAHLG
jgi:leader peptidase (prepilin peptidase)/N-methyltransferase